jgi:transcription elongation factor GreA-like protein
LSENQERLEYIAMTIQELMQYALLLQPFVAPFIAKTGEWVIDELLENGIAALRKQLQSKDKSILLNRVKAHSETEGQGNSSVLIDMLIKAFQENQAWPEQIRALLIANEASEQDEQDVHDCVFSPNLANTVKVLRDGMTAEDFDLFCFIHFPVVHQSFSNGMGKIQRINRLLEHAKATCQNRRLTELLEQEVHEQVKLFPLR